MAQCIVRVLPLEERATGSVAIVEGKVLSAKSFWNPSGKLILTSHQIEVYKVLKGNVPDTLEVLTQGGVVGDRMLKVSGGLQLKIDDMGLFLLEPENIGFDNRSGQKPFKVFAGKQGFYRYGPTLKTAASVYETFEIGEKFYQIFSPHGYREIKKLDAIGPQEGLKAIPFISSVEPLEVSAGTKSRITIRGSGFGNSPSTIRFPDADQGGAGYVSPLPGEIIQWQDDGVVVEVPSTAGSGRVSVVVQGITAISTQTLNITWAHTNFIEDDRPFQPYLVGQENTGGYIWRMENSFSQNPGASAAFARALAKWRCHTDVNWFIGEPTQVDAVEPDNISVVRFDNWNELSPEVLGVCYSWYQACRPNSWFVTELDLVFKPNVNWNFDEGLPSGHQYDFESVALHELGHGHQLGHVINPADLMHYSYSSGDINRNINPYNLEGGLYVMERGVNNSICENPPMEPLPVDICEAVNLSDFHYEGLSIFPNPFKEKLAFRYKVSEKTDVSIEIFNMLGQSVYSHREQQLPVGFYEGQVPVEMTGLTNGLYFLRFTRNGKRETYKILAW